MDKIKQWSLTVSAISILSGVLISLLPKSSHKNLFKTITGIILIYAVMQPIIGGSGVNFKIGEFISDNYTVSENIDKYARSSIVDSAEKAIENLLSEEAAKIEVNCKFKCRCKIEDNKIKVELISVTPALDTEDAEKIRNISETMGFDKDIIIFEGEKNE